MSAKDQSETCGLLHLQLSPDALKYVDEARTSAPARRPQSSGARNTTWRFASQKMGWTISCESTLEHDFICCAEFDPDILEFWDQPPQVPLIVQTPQGTRRTLYTPDFLVLSSTSASVIQVKPLEVCAELHQKRPYRWAFGDGQPIDLAARHYFDGIGLMHRVVTCAAISPLRAENCRLLMQARRTPVHGDLACLAGRVIRHLDKQSACTLSVLMQSLHLEEATSLLRLIDAGLIVTDLSRFRLSDPTRTLVSTTPAALQALLDAHQTMALPPSAKPIAALSTKEALEIATRMKQLSGAEPPLVSTRTLRRWRRAMRTGKSSPISLTPRYRHRGNRTSRLTASEREVITRTVDEHYLTPLAPTVSTSYREYLLRHEDAVDKFMLPPTSAPVSRHTFNAFCRRLDPEMAGRTRAGMRQGNADAAPVAPERRSLTPNRPFERVHIDHYKCDLHVVVADCDTKGTRRPWLSAARDQATDAVLGIHLGFKDPSINACHGVLRDLVRRHSRLPETVVVDNGGEFDSTYFEALLASYGVSKQSRPPGAPRFGAHIEGLFKQLSSQLGAVPGNLNNDVKTRQACRRHKGQAHARLSPYDAYQLIERLCFDHFNQHGTGSIARSPQQLLEAGLEMWSCSGVPITDQDQWLALSAIPLRKLKFDRARGVRHQGRWFFSPLLLRVAHGKRLEAFADPWDANVLYVQIDGERVACRHGVETEQHRAFDVATMINATIDRELTDLRAISRRKRDVSAARIAREALRPKTQPQPHLPTAPQRTALLPERDTAPTPYDPASRGGK